MNKYRLWYLIKRIPKIPHNLFNECIYFSQRGFHGWSEKDVWNLDHYLSKVLASSLLYLANTTHGHPCRMVNANNFPACCDSCDCSKLWDSELRENAEKFKLISEDYFVMKLSDTDVHWADKELKTQDEVLEWLRRWFWHLWD